MQFNQTYSYDNLNRVTQAGEGSSWGRGFDYDSYGNMWVDPSTSRTFGIQPAGNTPMSDVYNSNNQITGSNNYDGNGNQVAVNSASASYDAENRVINTTEPQSMGGYVDNYVYDGNGKRVEKIVNGATVVYVYDAFGDLDAEYTNASSSQIASPCYTPCYLTHDYLGSLRLLTDRRGNVVVARHDYLPFGEEIPAGTGGRTAQWGPSNDANIPTRFTGQLRDLETGLDYFGARYFGAALGRFTSVDPTRLSAFIDNPQTWNRYSYAYNNPLGLVDKNGKWPTSIHNQIIDAAFPNLSAAQRQILKDVSAQQDSILGGGQANSMSFQHAMRGPDQTVTEARQLYNDFVANNEDMATQTQVQFWLAGNPGYSNKALAEFAAALHAILDSTSPAHAGFQLWDWRNPALVWNHHRAENSITPQQLNTAVTAAQNAFNSTFSPSFGDPFGWLQLQFQQPQPQPQPVVTSKICYTDDNGNQVCQ